MIAKNRLTVLLLLCMMGLGSISNAQSDNSAKVTIEMTYEDAKGEKHSETIEYVGEKAMTFDADEYEKSLEKRDIKILNLNINQSFSKESNHELHEAHDVKIKQKPGKSKKSVSVKKIIISDSDHDINIEKSMDSDTYKVEEKDGKIFVNGKEVEGDGKQIRIMKTMDADDEMKVEVKDGKVFINGEAIDESEVKKSSESRIIVKSIGVDDKTKVEVKDGKIFIDGKEIAESGMGKRMMMIKKEHGEPGEYSDHVIIEKFEEIDLDSMGNVWISDDGKSHDIHKKGKRMIFISDDGEATDLLKKDHNMLFVSDEAPKPRLGIMIEDGKAVNGAEIVDVIADSPAAKAGLKKGDTVTAVNGASVYGVTSMMDKVSAFNADEEVSVTYSRGGKIMTTMIKVEMMDTMIEKEIIIKKEKK